MLRDTANNNYSFSFGTSDKVMSSIKKMDMYTEFCA